jgi:hypothetical protein
VTTEGVPTLPTTRPLAPALEAAHRHAVRAATAGLQDAGLAGLRLTGPGVPALAEAAVSSATPFLRSPLLARISGVLRLHPPGGNADGECSTCHVEAPCATSRAAQW